MAERPIRKSFDWVITDTEALFPGEQPRYPFRDRLITFVIRVPFAGEEHEFMMDGFRYGKHFVWDIGHKQSVSINRLIRWRYKDGGRKPTYEELAPIYERRE